MSIASPELGGGLKGALIGAIGGAYFGSLHGANFGEGLGGMLAKGAAHSLGGGMMAAMSGGDVGSGMIGGFINGAFAGTIDGFGGTGFEQGDIFVRVAASGFLGGATALVAGGKFMDGFQGAAFARLLNDENGLKWKKAELQRISNMSNGKVAHDSHSGVSGDYATKRALATDIKPTGQDYMNVTLGICSVALPGAGWVAAGTRAAYLIDGASFATEFIQYGRVWASGTGSVAESMYQTAPFSPKISGRVGVITSVVVDQLGRQ